MIDRHPDSDRLRVAAGEIEAAGVPVIVLETIGGAEGEWIACDLDDTVEVHP